MQRGKKNFTVIDTKLEVLRRLQEGETAAFLAREFNVHPASIRRWQKKAPLLSQFEGNSASRKMIRYSVFPELDSRMYEWVLEQQIMRHVSPREIQLKALDMNEELGGPQTFTASNGWYGKFIRRHSLFQYEQLIPGQVVEVNTKRETDEDTPMECHSDSHSETSSETRGESNRETDGTKSHRETSVPTHPADKSTAESFLTYLHRVIEEGNYTYDNVYNFDETGLLYKALPLGSVGSKSMLKNRVILGVCANATGTHKLPLLVVGRGPRLSCFASHREALALPVSYSYSCPRGQACQACMSQDVFLEWFADSFIHGVARHHEKQGRRGLRDRDVLLIVDNAASHQVPERLTWGRHAVVFIPPDSPSSPSPSGPSGLQPMERGITSELKRAYRRRLVGRFIESESTAISEFGNEFTVKDACLMADAAWQEVSSDSIRRAWGALIPEMDARPRSQDPVSPSAEDEDDVEDEVAELSQLLSRSTRTTDLGELDTDSLSSWLLDIRSAEAVSEQPVPVDVDADAETDLDDDAQLPTDHIYEAWRLVTKYKEDHNLTYEEVGTHCRKNCS